MNLTELSRNFKKGLKYLALAVIFYYLTTLLIIPGVKLLLSASFPEKNPPNPAYGKLPPLTLIEKPINEETPKYSINTTSGRLPTGFPDRMTVYRFIKRQQSFLKGTEATEDAIFLGFTEEDLSSDRKGETITWSNRNTTSKLNINLETYELSMNTNYEKNPEQYPRGTFDEDEAKRITQNLFRKLRRFDDTLYPAGYAEVYMGEIKGTATVRPFNNREAQVARVDLYRNINDYPILGEDPKRGLLYAIVKKPAAKEDNYNYPVISANYREVNSESKATYPILTVEEAWKAVSGDQGVITSVIPRDYNPFDNYRLQRVESILTDNIYLAYYETDADQEFLQPIWVFEGKYTTKGTEGGSIVIYYPAVKGEYVRHDVSNANTE